MRNYIFILGLVVCSSVIFGQTQFEKLVQEGITHRDNGDFDKAIKAYEKALKVDSESAFVHYQLAVAHMYVKEYKDAISHADQVIKMDDQFVVESYVLKGSCLDYMGKQEQSIKVYKKGLKKQGDHHLLYYNMGYVYYDMGQYDEAEEAVINAINAKPDHATSHLLLGLLKMDKGQKVQSLLCLHYFLLLEPNSERAQTAYELLQEQFGGNVERDGNTPNQINIFADAGEIDSEFSAANMMISMLAATKFLEENEGKTEEELFIENTTSFFVILGELKEKKNKGLWWDFYVPLFYDLAESKHIDTYCYYISQSSSEVAVDWLAKNEKRISSFNQWLNER